MGKAFDLSQYIQPDKFNVSESNTNRREIVMLPARKIFANDMNFYDVSNIDDLVNSILIHGLLEPITVRPAGDGEGYIIISGHRRYSSWMKILDDELCSNTDDFKEIPCIIVEPKDELIEELMLIQANSATRVLSAAEVSKQAERVEELVYKLKEQGYEFPGRMRDYVASMCNVSATKIAKLKVIREGLCPEYISQFNASLITEQAAYSIARLPKEFQQRLYKVDPTISGCNASYIVSAYIDKGWRWDPQQNCPDGSPCKRGDAFLRHDIHCLSSEMCGGNKCCLQCSHGNSEYYACDRSCSKLQAIRKSKRDEKADAEKKANEAKQSRLKAEVRASCARLARAADAAGLPDDVCITVSYSPIPISTIRSYAKGEFGDAHLYGNDFAPNNIRNYPELSKALSCSADYLAGLTDDLRPGACEAESLEEPDVLDDTDNEDEAIKVRWEGRSVTPPVGSLILTCNLTNDGYVFRPAEWSGNDFHAPGKPNKVLNGLQFVRWLKVPLFDEECEYDRTAPLALHTGLPAASGFFAAKFECEGYVMKKMAYYNSDTGKFYFDKSYDTSIDADCIGWTRLPEDF